MQIIKKLAFLVVGLLVFQSTQTVIVRGEIWRLKRQDGSYCYVYAMYDMHIAALQTDPNIQIKKLLDLAQSQYRTLIHNFKILPQKDIKILIEDPHSYQSGKLTIPEDIYKASKALIGSDRDILEGLVGQLKREGIEFVINIDVRQQRCLTLTYNTLMNMMSGLEILVSNPEILQMMDSQTIVKQLNAFHEAGLSTASLSKYKGAMDLKNRNLLEELESAIDKVEHYQDGPLLSAYYREQIDLIKSGNKNLYQLMRESKEKTMKEFEVVLGGKAMLYGMGFVMQGATLLDMNALHEIYQSVNDTKKIFLIAGGVHVFNVTRILPKMGYELVYETGAQDSLFEAIAKDSAKQSSLDVFMNMNPADLEVTLANMQKTSSAFSPLFKKRIILNPKFFDLMLSDDPQEGWALGHGPIQ